MLPSDTDSTIAARPLVAGLLAGGGSRRMGRSKASIALGGTPLAARVAAALATVAEVRVQLGGEPLSPPGWPVVPDRRESAGPAGGIEAGLLAFPGAALIVCAVDLPFVSGRLLKALLKPLEDGALAAAPHHGGRWHPLCAAYSPAVLPHLTARLDRGEPALQALLDSHGTRLETAALEAAGDPERLLMNVNTPEELERARAALR